MGGRLRRPRSSLGQMLTGGVMSGRGPRRLVESDSLSCPTGTLAMAATQKEANPRPIPTKVRQTYLLLDQIVQTLIVNITARKADISSDDDDGLSGRLLSAIMMSATMESTRRSHVLCEDCLTRANRTGLTDSCLCHGFTGR